MTLTQGDIIVIEKKTGLFSSRSSNLIGGERKRAPKKLFKVRKRFFVRLGGGLLLLCVGAFFFDDDDDDDEKQQQHTRTHA